MIPEFVGLQKLLSYYLGTNGHHRWKLVVFVASIRPQAVFSTHRVCLKRNVFYIDPVRNTMLKNKID